MDAIDLIGPEQRAFLHVDPPVSDIGALLCHLEQAVVFAQLRIALAVAQFLASPSPYIAHDANEIAYLAIVVPARRHMRFEPHVMAIGMLVAVSGQRRRNLASEQLFAGFHGEGAVIGMDGVDWREADHFLGRKAQQPFA